MIVKNFPWVVLGASIISWIEPGLFSWFHGVLITLALGGIMVGMGLHLQWKDFLVVKESPWSVFLGVFLQYTIMPLAGAWIALVLDLKPPFYAGLVLVACCPGGTASNVIVYLAKANLALSVVLTSLSTIFAIFMTPLLTSMIKYQVKKKFQKLKKITKETSLCSGYTTIDDFIISWIIAGNNRFLGG